jgi:hypothetical protein
MSVFPLLCTPPGAMAGTPLTTRRTARSRTGVNSYDYSCIRYTPELAHANISNKTIAQVDYLEYLFSFATYRTLHVQFSLHVC